jgi:hypothetical protein
VTSTPPRSDTPPDRGLSTALQLSTGAGPVTRQAVGVPDSVIAVLVFDATAIEALFHGHDVLYRLFVRADEGKTTIVFPALAVVEAGTALGASAASWEMYLWVPNVEIVPLGEAAAVEISTWQGTFAARQSLWEAQRINCPLITCDAGLYAPGQAVVVQV